jgi:IS30 family transposase
MRGLTTEKLERLKKLNAEGLPDRAIAARLGVSPRTIQANRLRLGIWNDSTLRLDRVVVPVP